MGVARVGGDTAVLSDAGVLAAKRGEKMIGAPGRKKGGSGTGGNGDSDNGSSDIPSAPPSSVATTDTPSAAPAPMPAFALPSDLAIIPIALALVRVVFIITLLRCPSLLLGHQRPTRRGSMQIFVRTDKTKKGGPFGSQLE